MPHSPKCGAAPGAAYAACSSTDPSDEQMLPANTSVFTVHPHHTQEQPCPQASPSLLATPQLLPTTDADWSCQRGFITNYSKAIGVPSLPLQAQPTGVLMLMNQVRTTWQFFRQHFVVSDVLKERERWPGDCGSTRQSGHSSYWQGHQYCGAEWAENNLDVRLIYGCLSTFCEQSSVYQFQLLKHM